MGIERRISPIEAAVSVIGRNGSEMPLGKTMLHVLHVNQGLATLAGVVTNEAGERICKVDLDGIPVSSLPAGRKAGRPPADEKHCAVLLAWAANLGAYRGKFAGADSATANQFGYSGEEKVRNIRNKQAKKLGIDLKNDIFTSRVENDAEKNWAVLIGAPTFYLDDDVLTILGGGYAWTDEDKNRVFSVSCCRVTVPRLNSSDDFLDLRNKRGPIIVSGFRPDS